MALKNPKCPVCQGEACVHKVSLLYMIGITDEKELTAENAELFARIYSAQDADGKPRRLARAEMREAIKRFAPPSGKDRVVRPINPDIAMIAMLIVGIVFLFNIFKQQPQFFPYAAGLLGLLFVGYILLRKRITGKYQSQLSETSTERKIVEKAVDRWMKLHYCETDEVVFDPNRNKAIPLPYLQEYIVTGKVSGLAE